MIENYENLAMTNCNSLLISDVVASGLDGLEQSSQSSQQSQQPQQPHPPLPPQMVSQQSQQFKPYSLAASTSTLVDRFQYVLVAPTSPAVKCTEETLTYLNQGQNYELKMAYLGLGESSSSMYYHHHHHQQQSQQQHIDMLKKYEHSSTPSYDPTSSLSAILKEEAKANDGLTFLSIIRLCFWDRKLQEIELEEIKEWEKEYENVRMLEVDQNTNIGVLEIRQLASRTNACEVVWSGKNGGASLALRCNCTSTAFAPHKHGGEKGIHMRLQIDTYEMATTRTARTSSAVARQSVSLPPPPPPPPPQAPMPSNNCCTSETTTTNECCASSLSSPQSPHHHQTHKKLNKEENAFEAAATSNNAEFSFAQLTTVVPTATAAAAATSSSRMYGTNRHLCSSYTRVQLFRLKGAQRKLKTDRCKIERLTPNDLRKRYQVASRVTVLYNTTAFDPLYSLMPSPPPPLPTSSSPYLNLIQPVTTPPTTTTAAAAGSTTLAVPSSSSSSSDLSYYYPTAAGSSGAVAMSSIDGSSGGGVGEFTLPPPLPLQQTSELTSSYSNLLGFNCIPPPSSQVSAVSPSIYSVADHGLAINPNCTPIHLNEPTSIGDHFYTSPYDNYSSMGFGLKRTSSYNSMENMHYQYPESSSAKLLKSSHHHYHPHLNHHHRHQYTVLGATVSSISSSSSLDSSSSSSPPSSSLSSTSSSSSSSSTSSPDSPVKREPITAEPMPPLPPPLPLPQPQSPSSIQVPPVTPLPHPGGLPYNCSHKYLEEWLLRHRFASLLPLFNCYATNDVLRLSKDDLVKLCGAPDGIRLFNLAHNIQIKPKLSLFVTFSPPEASYYTAVFLTEWRADSLIRKIIAAYFAYSKTAAPSTSTSISSSSSTATTNSEASSSQRLCSELASGLNDYELFLKVRDVLVRTNDEVLNNLQDQSKFFVDFELPRNTTATTPTTESLTGGNRFNLKYEHLAQSDKNFCREFLLDQDSRLRLTLKEFIDILKNLNLTYGLDCSSTADNIEKNTKKICDEVIKSAGLSQKYQAKEIPIVYYDMDKIKPRLDYFKQELMNRFSGIRFVMVDLKSFESECLTINDKLNDLFSKTYPEEVFFIYDHDAHDLLNNEININEIDGVSKNVTLTVFYRVVSRNNSTGNKRFYGFCLGEFKEYVQLSQNNNNNNKNDEDEDDDDDGHDSDWKFRHDSLLQIRNPDTKLFTKMVHIPETDDHSRDVFTEELDNFYQQIFIR